MQPCFGIGRHVGRLVSVIYASIWSFPVGVVVSIARCSVAFATTFLQTIVIHPNKIPVAEVTLGRNVWGLGWMITIHRWIIMRRFRIQLTNMTPMYHAWKLLDCPPYIVVPFHRPDIFHFCRPVWLEQSRSSSSTYTKTCAVHPIIITGATLFA